MPFGAEPLDDSLPRPRSCPSAMYQDKGCGMILSIIFSYFLFQLRLLSFAAERLISPNVKGSGALLGIWSLEEQSAREII